MVFNDVTRQIALHTGINLVAVPFAVLCFFLVRWIAPHIPHAFEKLSPKTAARILFGLIGLYIIAFSVYTIARYELYAVQVFDVGHISQAFWNTVHGAPFRMTTFAPFTTRFFYHVEPIILLLSPLYALWQDPRNLMVIQTIWLGLGAYPVFWIAQRILKNSGAALLLGGAYLLNPALHQATMFDVHMLAFGATPLLAGFAFLLARRFPLAFLSFLIATFAREEYGTAVFVFGIIAFFKFHRGWGAAIALTGLAWSVLTLGLIIPTLNTTGTLLQTSFNRYGGTPLEILKTIATNPLVLFEAHGWLGKSTYVLTLLAPFAFLALRAPVFLLTTLFFFAEFFLDDRPQHNVGRSHHEIALLAPLVLAAIWGMRAWVRQRHTTTRSVVSLALVIFFTSAFLFLVNQVTGLGLVSRLYSPYSSERIAAAREAEKRIPANASVTSSWALAAQVTNRRDLFLFMSSRWKDADFLYISAVPDFECFDAAQVYQEYKKDSKYNFAGCEARGDEYAARLAEVLADPAYVKLFDQSQVLVFQRVAR